MGKILLSICAVLALGTLGHAPPVKAEVITEKIRMSVPQNRTDWCDFNRLLICACVEMKSLTGSYLLCRAETPLFIQSNMLTVMPKASCHKPGFNWKIRTAWDPSFDSPQRTILDTYRIGYVVPTERGGTFIYDYPWYDAWSIWVEITGTNAKGSCLDYIMFTWITTD